MNAKDLYDAFFRRNNNSRRLIKGQRTAQEILDDWPPVEDFNRFRPEHWRVERLADGRFKIKALPSYGDDHLITLAFGDMLGAAGNQTFGNPTPCYELAGDGEMEYENLSADGNSFVYEIFATALIVTPGTGPIVIVSKFCNRSCGRTFTQKFLFSLE